MNNDTNNDALEKQKYGQFKPEQQMSNQIKNEEQKQVLQHNDNIDSSFQLQSKFENYQNFPQMIQQQNQDSLQFSNNSKFQNLEDNEKSANSPFANDYSLYQEIQNQDDRMRNQKKYDYRNLRGQDIQQTPSSSEDRQQNQIQQESELAQSAHPLSVYFNRQINQNLASEYSRDHPVSFGANAQEESKYQSQVPNQSQSNPMQTQHQFLRIKQNLNQQKKNSFDEKKSIDSSQKINNSCHSKQTYQTGQIEPEYNEQYDQKMHSLLGSIQQSPQQIEKQIPAQIQPESGNKYHNKTLEIQNQHEHERAFNSQLNTIVGDNQYQRRNTTSDQSSIRNSGLSSTEGQRRIIHSSQGEQQLRQQMLSGSGGTTGNHQEILQRLQSSNGQGENYMFLAGLKEVDDYQETINASSSIKASQFSPMNYDENLGNTFQMWRANKSDKNSTHNQEELKNSSNGARSSSGKRYSTKVQNPISQHERNLFKKKLNQSDGHNFQNKAQQNQNQDFNEDINDRDSAGDMSLAQSLQKKTFKKSNRQSPFFLPEQLNYNAAQSLRSMSKQSKYEHQISFGEGEGSSRIQQMDFIGQEFNQESNNKFQKDDYFTHLGNNNNIFSHEIPQNYKNQQISDKNNEVLYQEVPNFVDNQLIQKYEPELISRKQKINENRRFYRLALAQIGEKVCMRQVLKDLIMNLEGINKNLCTQSVQQEILLNIKNDNNAEIQIKNLIESIILQSEENEQDNLEYNQQKINQLKRMSNLQLLETVRMDSKMIQLRQSDLMKQENNIYLMFAKEKERNKLLQQELTWHEENQNNQNRILNNVNSGTSTIISKQPSSFVEDKKTNLPASADTITTSLGKFNQNVMSNTSTNKNISQPLNQFDSSKLSMNNQFNSEHIQASDLLIKQINEKEKQLEILNDYVKTIMNEFQSIKDNTVNLKLNIQEKQLVQQNVEDKQKVLSLHTQIYNLKRQNLNLVDQIKQQNQGQTIEEQTNQNMSIMSLQNTRKLSMGTQDENLRVPKKNLDQYQDLRKRPQSFEQIRELTEKSNTFRDLKDDDSNKSENDSYLNKHYYNQIQNQKTSTFKRQDTQDQKILKDLKQQLEQQKQQIENYKINQVKISDKSEKQEVLQAQLRVLTKDLERQGLISSEALQKAGEVIHKLNEELQQSYDSVQNLEEENQTLKDDINHSRLQMQYLQQQSLEKEKSMEAKMQRIDNELNLEIKELKDALQQYQNDQDQKFASQDQDQQNLQVKLQQTQNERQQLLQDYQTLRDDYNKFISSKTFEILDYQDKYLSLKIEMNQLQKQLEQDLEIQEQIHRKDTQFMKNQINQLNLQLGQMNQQNIRVFPNENIQPKKLNEFQVSNGSSYMHEFTSEFNSIANEILKIKDLVYKNKDKVIDNREEFNDFYYGFKNKVLDAIILWNQKTEGLGKIAQKNSDTLENYHMLFVQMKQLIKDKDALLNKMRVLNRTLISSQNDQVEQVKKDATKGNLQVLQSSRVLADSLKIQLGDKFSECHELIQYQSEFREEYLKVCAQKDEIELQLKCLDEELRIALQRLEKDGHDHNQFVFTLLNILEIGTNIADPLHAIPQAISTILMNSNHQYQKQNEQETVIQKLQEQLNINKSNYQEKEKENYDQMQSQRKKFQENLKEMESQMEKLQSQYLCQQEEQQQTFTNKIQELDEKNQSLLNILNSIKQEVEYKDRLLKKNEQKTENQSLVQKQLQDEIDKLIKEKMNHQEIERNMREAISSLEKNFKELELRFDSKLQKNDQLENSLHQEQMKNQRLEVDLKAINDILEARCLGMDEMHQEIKSYKQNSIDDRVQINELQNMLQQKEFTLRSLQETYSKMKDDMVKYQKSFEDSDAKILLHEQTKFQMENDILRYQDSISYLSRVLDQQKLQILDLQIVEEQNTALKDKIEETHSQVSYLKNTYVDKQRQESGCQTENNLIEQQLQLQNLIYQLHEELRVFTVDNYHQKQCIARYQVDIDRINQEKIQLEKDFQFKLNQISQMKTEVTFSEQKEQYLRQRSGSPSISRQAKNTHPLRRIIENDGSKFKERNLFVLEKDPNLRKLENELNNIRLQKEKIQERLIINDIKNMDRQNHSANKYPNMNEQNGMKHENRNEGGILKYNSTQIIAQQNGNQNMGNKNYFSNSNTYGVNISGFTDDRTTMANSSGLLQGYTKRLANFNHQNAFVRPQPMKIIDENYQSQNIDC